MQSKMFRTFPLVFFFILCCGPLFGQNSITGTVTDLSFGQEVLGARVTIKGSSTFTETDENGKFTLTTDLPYPVTLIIEGFGFEEKEYVVKSARQRVNIGLGDNSTLLDGVEIQKINISEKQKESALTVESMSLMAIKQCPAVDFYEGLGSLKGVDLTSASIGV